MAFYHQKWNRDTAKQIGTHIVLTNQFNPFLADRPVIIIVMVDAESVSYYCLILLKPSEAINLWQFHTCQRKQQPWFVVP